MTNAVRVASILLVVAVHASAQGLEETAWRFRDSVWLGRFDQGSASFTMYLSFGRCDGRTFSGTSRWVDLGDSLVELEGEIDSGTGELLWRYTNMVRGGGIVLDGTFRARLSTDRRGLIGTWTSADGRWRFAFSCRDARFRPAMLRHLLPPETLDPETARRIADLVAALGDSRWGTRERASEALAGMGEVAAEALARAADGDPDPEVRARCRALLRRQEAPADLASSADDLHDFAAHAARVRLADDPRFVADLLKDPEVRLGRRAAALLVRRMGERLRRRGASIERFSPP